MKKACSVVLVALHRSSWCSIRVCTLAVSDGALAVQGGLLAMCEWVGAMYMQVYTGSGGSSKGSSPLRPGTRPKRQPETMPTIAIATTHKHTPGS